MPEFSLDFHYAYGKPTAEADFRTQPQDFIVVENLGFELSGEGEHLFVEIKKTGENSGWVAEQLAKHFGIRSMDVGMAGLKDRHAITSQWFSLYLPKHEKEVDWQAFLDSTEANVEILNWGWHKQKLRRGAHQSNRFTITLRNLSSVEGLEDRLSQIQQYGVPNYFGEQRFGREAGNLDLAQKWFVDGEQIRKKKLRGMVMSAARSYLFNLVLSQRVQQQAWTQPIDGEPAFGEAPESLAAGTQATGPLWGRGLPLSSGDTRTLEEEVLVPNKEWLDGLEHCGLDQERRILCLLPQDFTWELDDSTLVLSFGLAPGLFATSVMRELVQLNNLSQVAPQETV